MSQLVEKLRRAGERGRPLGFGARSETRFPSLVLVALVDATDSPSLEAAVAAGADALLLRGDATPILPSLQERLAGLPWGLEGPGPTVPEGCDFLVLEPQAPLSFLREAPWGRLLRVVLPFEEGWLRGLGPLPIDALFIDQRDRVEPLTLHHLALCQQAIALSGKPAILGAPAHLSPADLVVLRDAGLHGVALALRRGEADRLRAFREASAALPPPKRRGERPPALLPREAVYPSEAIEEEEDQ